MTEVETEMKVEETKETLPEPEKNESIPPKEENKDDSEVLAKIADRLRFFFSDANLRIDAFMRREILGTREYPSDGYVKIETLLKFNTIRSISDDPSMIAKAVNLESVSSKIKLNDDGTSICRVEPFTMEMMDGNVPLSLRVDNLPVKETENGKRVYGVSRQDIENLFKEQKDFGPVALVRMQYESRKKNFNAPAKATIRPKGWALVEFETVEDLQKAEAELCCAEGEEKPKRVLKLLDNELRFQNFKKWIDAKPDKKRKRDLPEKDEGEETNEKKETNEDRNLDKVDYNPFTLDWQKGCVIRLKGVGESCDREAILAAVAEFMGTSDDKKIAFADYSRGQPDAAVRFHEHSTKITEFQKKLDAGEITIAGSKVESAFLLEGEEESNYYKAYVEFKNKQRAAAAGERSRKRQRHGGRHGGRNRGFGRGRGRGRN